MQELPDFQKVKRADLQTLNINPEAYRQWFQEIEFGTDYQTRLIAQHVRNARLKWLTPAEQTAAEDVRIEHYVAILPYKPK